MGKKFAVTTQIEQEVYNTLRARAQGEGIELNTLLERLASRQSAPSTFELQRRIMTLERRVNAMVENHAQAGRKTTSTAHLETHILDMLSGGRMKRGHIRARLVALGVQVTDMPLRQALERLRGDDQGSVTLAGQYYSLRVTSAEGDS